MLERDSEVWGQSLLPQHGFEAGGQPQQVFSADRLSRRYRVRV